MGKLNKARRNCCPSLQDPRESQQSPCPQTHLSLRVDPLEAQICRRFRHTSTPTPSGDSARAPRALFLLQAIYLKHISNSIGFASGRSGNRIDFNRKRRPDFVDSCCFRARISGGAASTTRHGGALARPTVQTRLLTRLLEEVWFPGHACQRLLASLFTSLFAGEREAACTRAAPVAACGGTDKN